MLDSQNSTGRILAETTQLPTYAALQEKGRMIWSRTVGPEEEPQATVDYSQALKPDALLDFKITWDK